MSQPLQNIPTLKRGELSLIRHSDIHEKNSCLSSTNQYPSLSWLGEYLCRSKKIDSQKNHIKLSTYPAVTKTDINDATFFEQTRRKKNFGTTAKRLQIRRTKKKKIVIIWSARATGITKQRSLILSIQL